MKLFSAMHDSDPPIRILVFDHCQYCEVPASYIRRHCEEANTTTCQSALNYRPTKNLSSSQPQYVLLTIFLPFMPRSMGIRLSWHAQQKRLRIHSLEKISSAIPLYFGINPHAGIWIFLSSHSRVRITIFTATSKT